MKLASVLDALRSGAHLHLSLAKKPTWCLAWDIPNDGVTVLPISSRVVFAEVPSQTWRYAEPIEGA
jgi:hypothetical protein